MHSKLQDNRFMKSFVHQQNTYEKWVLNKPFQAKMVQSMLSLADIDEIASIPIEENVYVTMK